MKKKDFVTLIMSVVGGIPFALGMCMALLPEWNLLKEGIVIGAVGIVILLAMALVRSKMSGKPMIIFNAKAIATTVYGIFATAVFGVGMCMVTAFEMMVPGIIVGMIGMILLICLIPIIKGLK